MMSPRRLLSTRLETPVRWPHEFRQLPGYSRCAFQPVRCTVQEILSLRSFRLEARSVCYRLRPTSA